MVYFTSEIGPFLGYLESMWSGDLADRIRILTYDEALSLTELPASSAIFTDHERMVPSQRRVAEQLWKAYGDRDLPRMNHPTRVLFRQGLLGSLKSLGINSFTAVGGEDPLHDLRFPVFVRESSGHTGNLTRLLGNRSELDWSLGMLTRFGGYRKEDLVVVEYCETQKQFGMFAKYSAFRVGDRVIPRSIEFGQHWMVKFSDDHYNPEMAEFELEFMRRDPHGDRIREVFEAARISFGRVDYSLREDGGLAVWEINTNAQPATQPLSWGARPSTDLPDYPLRRKAKELFFDAFREALSAVDVPPRGASLPWTVDAGLVRACRREQAEERQRAQRQKRLRSLRRFGPLRAGAKWLANRAARRFR